MVGHNSDAPFGFYYHGTDVASALALLNCAPLDAAVASANKLDGPLGFFLATDARDAVYFALRKGEGVVLRFEISVAAAGSLVRSGAVVRPIPFGGGVHFSGNELYVPPGAFDYFNRLRKAGEIRVRPHIH